MKRSIFEREGVDACSALVRHTVNNAALQPEQSKKHTWKPCWFLRPHAN
jgi:hypothetical protein